jgi:hypothetical protein
MPWKGNGEDIAFGYFSSFGRNKAKIRGGKHVENVRI